MNKVFKFCCYATLLVCALFISSCSNEEPVIVEFDNKQTLTANSATSILIEQTVSNDGSHDNIIDGSSCFDISLPYKVVIKGVEITIASADDLKMIEELFDEIETDDDVLDIIFPITITLPDYTELIINSIEDLREKASKCIEGGGDEDIECIDLIYPVTLFTFNPNIEQTGSITVENDRDMRVFFASLNVTDLISIEFPLEFEMFDGDKVIVNSNQELKDALELAKEVCDEDDDADYNDDDFTEEQLDELLVVCPWIIKEIVRPNFQGLNAEIYANFILNFNDDGTVKARDKEGNVLEGEWSTKIDDNQVKLTLNFEFIEAFSLEWFVYEINKNKIKLHILSADNEKIILKKVCQEPNVECSEALIKESLLDDCVWEVSDGESGSFLEDLNINFSNMDILVENSNEAIVDQGNWSIYQTTITFNNFSKELANYIGDWEVIECRSDRFKMKKGDQYLVFEKECK